MWPIAFVPGLRGQLVIRGPLKAIAVALYRFSGPYIENLTLVVLKTA